MSQTGVGARGKCHQDWKTRQPYSCLVLGKQSWLHCHYPCLLVSRLQISCLWGRVLTLSLGHKEKQDHVYRIPSSVTGPWWTLNAWWWPASHHRSPPPPLSLSLSSEWTCPPRHREDQHQHNSDPHCALCGAALQYPRPPKSQVSFFPVRIWAQLYEIFG